MPQYLRFNNQTRNTLIADKVIKADSYFSRLFGLLPKHRLEPGEGLWIVPCKDIHSVGMRFQFDALFLDENLEVVYLIEKMKPLRISPFIRNAKSVLELEAGVIERTGTHVGDKLSWENNNPA